MGWESLFHPITVAWFKNRFGMPTQPQEQGWPEIAAGKHTLIAAPTGSGKTLAAFLICIDRLLRQALEDRLEEQTTVVYVSPLKALSNDIRRNLEVPLAELAAEAISAGLSYQPIRSAVRTGDTTATERQAMLRKPPHILVTTPESLYLLLTAERSRKILRGVRTVIVDEIHALARDKRGSHLTLTLQRLEALCDTPPVRIGLSATQKPMDEIANYLVGCHPDGTPRPCHLVDTGHVRQLDLGVVAPPSELNAVCSNEQWAEIYTQLQELIQSHRSTLIFVNTRRLAERLSYRLTELLGEDAVTSHHGSLSKEIRLDAEERLKTGKLKAIVATASLELGIDIGYIDLVCQIGSPRSIATFLQRVGRAGHSLGAIPKGRLFPVTRDDLLESLALLRAVRRGNLDRIEIPVAPLDILAQQIIATVCTEDWNEDALFELVRGAWPYRHLERSTFDEVIEMLSGDDARRLKLPARLHSDAINRELKASRGARIIAATCGGAIPDNFDYRVVSEDENTVVGTVNEDFAIESNAGDIFLLGNTSWRVLRLRGTDVVVQDAQGAPPTIPFWLGEAPGRTIELSTELSEFREEVARRIDVSDDHPNLSPAIGWIIGECGVDDWPARQAAVYIAAQKAALGLVPTQQQVVFERFFDEGGGMQLVVHSPYGTRINRAWGLALRKRFCRSFNFELQASADDNGIVLSLGAQHSFPIAQLFPMLNTRNGLHLLTQALLAAPLFQVRWRWNASRALAVLRQRGGKRVPPQLQRMRSEDLLSVVFPQTTACLENVVGDIPIPKHPLVDQTIHDCLTEAMDIDRWLEVLAKIESGQVELIARDTREPSPFSHQLINAYPYAFLDDAPLEERRARAVSTRRSLNIEELRDLAKLDPTAITLVRQQAWPTVRDAEELHDALLTLVAVPVEEVPDWQPMFDVLVRLGRATLAKVPNGQAFMVPAECWNVVLALQPEVVADPPLALPPLFAQAKAPEEASVRLVRGQLECRGPVTAAELADKFSLRLGLVQSALEALEGEGFALQGHFTVYPTGDKTETVPVEWCERRLLARIHRMTLSGARREIEPVEPEIYWQFLVEHQHCSPDSQLVGDTGVLQAIEQLQGFEASSGAWEHDILAARVRDYKAEYLDDLSLAGQVAWGRLQPPNKSEENTGRGTGLTRVVPISLISRPDLRWLLPANRPDCTPLARGDAITVLETLQQHGALFFQDLLDATGLLPTQLQDALSELAAIGAVTADSFACIRNLVAPKRSHLSGRRRRRTSRTMSTAGGRWSRFPAASLPMEPRERAQRWAWLLLRRYGVMFRDLLARETVAPAWWELVREYRLMEARGEVRGGRFVRGVAGEQYALPSAVESLRQVRRNANRGRWIILSAADPINLAGILSKGPRIPAKRGNTFALLDGRVVGTYIAKQVEFHAKLDPVLAGHIAHALQITSVRRRRELEIQVNTPADLSPAG